MGVTDRVRLLGCRVITTGRWADLTVLSKDILTVTDADILKAEVLYTIVNGKVAYARGATTR